jgi:hypothetical protein
MNKSKASFQTAEYGPTFPPGVGGKPYGLWLEARPSVMGNVSFILSTDWVASREMSDGIREQMTRTLLELGFAPKG